MSKAALLNVNVGNYDPRETTYEGARRHGPSHAQWTPDTGGFEHATPEESGSAGSALSILDALRETRNEHRPSTRDNVLPGGGPVVPSDLLLAKAIDAMERRTRRSKKRADAVVGPFGGAVDDSHSLDEDDRVFSLARRLSEIETRFLDRSPSVAENPVGTVLARLEARLDSFTRQSSLADVVALQHTLSQAPKSSDQPKALLRLEEKLDVILKAIETQRPETSPIAFAASYNSRRRADGRLGEAIDEIARRQQALILEGAGELDVRQTHSRKAARAFPLPREASNDKNGSLATIQSEIANLVKKVDGLCSAVSEQRANAPEPAGEIDSLRADIANLLRTMDHLRARVRGSDTIESLMAIVDRIAPSHDLAISEAVREELSAIIDAVRKVLVETDSDRSIASLIKQIHGIADCIQDLARGRVNLSTIADICQKAKDVQNLATAAVAKPNAVERVEYAIGVLQELIDSQEQQKSDSAFAPVIEELRDFVANPPSQITFVRIGIALDALETGLKSAVSDLAIDASARSKNAHSAQGEIEDLLRDLSLKMDAVQSPGADAEALNALQQQIALLSTRFEGADDGLAKLNSLQRSMEDIFAQLEQTRLSVESSAAEAAREVLRIAVKENQSQRASGDLVDRVQLQSIQDEAETRTKSALSAVQETLAKVVDRLSFMETEVAEVREGNKTHILAKVTPAKAATAKLNQIALGKPDPMLDLSLARRAPDVTSKLSKAGPIPAIPQSVHEHGKADFIAAARRAAKTVQCSLSAAETPNQGAPNSDPPPQTSFVERSRDYVACHRKPILLGIAALFVVVGSVTVAQRIGAGRGEAQKAAIAPRSHVAAATKPAPSKVQSTEKGLASMALLPETSRSSGPVVKSKPIAPAIAAGLPMFATPVAAPPPAIPVKLRSMAEAGNADAEYVLGTQFAEGRGVPRDFKTAATWYQRAADKGVVPAQYRLAALYEKGLGVAKDKVKSRGLYLQAAEAGNPRAMHNLAVLLADGDGKPDYEGAATWFRKAAQLGMEDSQYNLGILLARGLGVQQSLVQSYQWFAIAAAQDDADAAKKRDEVGSKLGTADLAVAKALAASFRPRAVSVAATEVKPPPGGWDGVPAPSALNSTKPKVSSL